MKRIPCLTNVLGVVSLAWLPVHARENLSPHQHAILESKSPPLVEARFSFDAPSRAQFSAAAKLEQRERGRGLLPLVRAAFSNGAAEVRIPAGHRCVGFRNCRNIVLRGATLARATPGQIEGRITKINRANNRFEIQPTPGVTVPTCSNGGDGGHLWKDCYFGPQPGSCQWKGADGFLSRSLRRGSTFDNATIRHTADDLANFHGIWGKVQVVSDTTVTLERNAALRPTLDNARPGDRLRFIHRKTGAWLGEATLVARQEFVVTLDRDAAPFAEGQASWPEHECAGWTVQNCRWEDSFQRLLIMSGPGAVRGCTFARWGNGIELNTGMGLVGGIPGDITISGNTFIDVDPRPHGSAIEARAHNALGQDGIPPIERLIIESNTFVRSGGPAIGLTGVRGARIAGNRFESPGRATVLARPGESARRQAVALTACSAVAMQSNALIDLEGLVPADAPGGGGPGGFEAGGDAMTDRRRLPAPPAPRPADDVAVYPPVPGLDASGHYTVRVRAARAGSAWKHVFAWETVCKPIEKMTDAYFDTLAGWTHTYVNFETAGAVEVEIARVNGQPIRTAAVHPQRKASGCAVEDGKVLVRLDKPCLVAVDIDGQMDGQDTGKGYRGPPIHTISVFANPPLSGKPLPDAPGVLAVKPGEKPSSDGPWTTLFFLPGVHDVGLAFPLRANRQYYIPGDAIVYGTLSNRKWGDGHHIRIFGHGTLSGARLKHPEYVVPAIPETEHGRYRPIEIVGTTDTRVEGITLADSATHSLMLIHPYKAGHPNTVQWTKIFTWRANGDGINPFGNTLIEDCFLRTQDDSLYVNGLGIRRTVLWNDANGSSFVLSALPQFTDRQLVVEDCDVIYARAKWHHWTGGRVFNMRGEGGGAAGAGVIFRNINIEDPRPTLQQFFLCMTVPEPYSRHAEKRDAGDLSGLRFENIAIAAPSVLGEPQILWGQPDARIRQLTFENLTLGGTPVRDAAFFTSNEFVERLVFAPGAISKP